jgi:hypothetical protein
MAKRYQRTIRSRKSKEGQTTQWGHCVVCPSFDLQLLIGLWYLLAIVLSVLPLIYGFWLPFGFFWPLWAIRSRKSKEGQTIQWPKDTKGQSEAVRLLIALWYLLAIVLSVLPLIYGFWLAFGIFWPLCCLSFLWFTASDCPVSKSKEGQTTQWPKDNKGQSEAVNQRKDRQYNGQKIPKGNQKP